MGTIIVFVIGAALGTGLLMVIAGIGGFIKGFITGKRAS
jgi:hypothetical protein